MEEYNDYDNCDDHDGPSTGDISIDTGSFDILDKAEKLKKELENLVDRHITDALNNVSDERFATEELNKINAALAYFGIGSALDKVNSLLKQNRELISKVQKTDEFLGAKRHYLPLVQKLITVAQEKNDQETINRINVFLVSGDVI